GISCLATLIVLLLLGAGALGVGVALKGARLITAVSSGPGTITAALNQIKLGPITKLAAVLPLDGKGGDLLVYAYGGADSRPSGARSDGASRATRWQSQPLSKEAYQGLLVAGQDMVYITDQDQLLALHLNDGALAWKAALAVEPQTGCDECLRLAGGSVMVLEKNSGLQAFNAKSGKLAWSTRLAENTRRLPGVGGRGVTTQPSKEKDGTLISFLDPASGKVALQLDPHCPERNTFSEFERPRYDTPLLFSADGKTMLTMYGFFSQCAQSFDLTSGKPRWEVTMEDGLVPPSWYNNTALLTDKAL